MVGLCPSFSALDTYVLSACVCVCVWGGVGAEGGGFHAGRVQRARGQDRGEVYHRGTSFTSDNDVKYPHGQAIEPVSPYSPRFGLSLRQPCHVDPSPSLGLFGSSLDVLSDLCGCRSSMWRTRREACTIAASRSSRTPPPPRTHHPSGLMHQGYGGT
jgi:hypothetical protein